MATLYFNAAVDSDWQTLGNWWTTGAFSTQASALPSSSDSVVLSATCDTNSGSEPTVVNLTYNSGNLSIPITVTGDATFNNSSYNNATLTGNATFNNSSSNRSAMYGNATFNNSSYAWSAINGDATFNGTSYNELTTVTGNATYNGSSYNDGTVSGNATFNDTSYNGVSYNNGIVNGNATFNDFSSNNVSLAGAGTVTFNDFATHAGGATINVGAGVTFNDSSLMLGDSGVSVTFNGRSAATTAQFYNIQSGGGWSITGDPQESLTVVGGNNPVQLTFSRVSPWPPLRGINGSSILGVI